MPIAVRFILVAPSAMWNGFVLMKLWGWFVVPTLGAPSLTVAAAIGISLMGRFVTDKGPTASEAMTWDRLGRLVVYSAIYPAFVLLIGWALFLATA